MYKAERESNIELIRIFSMIIIVLSHYTVHNGIINSNLELSFNKILLEISILGNLGTNLFIMITGYFMIEKNTHNIKKILNYILKVNFYSISIYLLFILLGNKSFNAKQFIESLFPIIFKKYWFATIYFIILIFHPYMNTLLNNLNKKQHKQFIYLLIITFYMIKTLTMQNFFGNEIIYCITAYSIGGYLKKYPNNFFRKNKKKNIIIISILFSFLTLTTLFFNILGIKYSFFNKHSTFFYSKTSVIILLLSISTFNLFLDLKIKKNKIINTIATSVFDVYLISDNPIIRDFLWIQFFKNKEYVTSNFMIVHMVISIILTYSICSLIGYIRNKTLENFNTNIINKILEKKRKE